MKVSKGIDLIQVNCSKKKLWKGTTSLNSETEELILSTPETRSR